MAARHSTATLIWIAALAALLGFGAGFAVARSMNDPDAGEIPCPPCKILKTAAGKCSLVGRIHPDWKGGPVYLMPPLVGEDDPLVSFDPGECFSEPVNCPGTATPKLLSWPMSSPRDFDIEVCEEGACSPVIEGCS